MGWTLLAIVVFIVVIAIASNLDQSREEKQKRKKAEEDRVFYNRVLEKQKIALQENQRQAEAQHREKSRAFNAELLRIPKVDIVLSDGLQDLTNWDDFPSDQLSIINPRTGARKSLYADFTVVDVETTGLDKYSEIIELSAIKYVNFEPVSCFSTLVKPSGTIPLKITQITHIDASMVSNAPTINQIMPAFIEYIGSDNILGHNLSFDLKFLYKSGFDCFAKKRRYYDTLKIARSHLSKDMIENHKLTTLCDYYNISRDDAHRSLSDCFATGKVYQSLLKWYSFKDE